MTTDTLAALIIAAVLAVGAALAATAFLAECRRANRVVENLHRALEHTHVRVLATSELEAARIEREAKTALAIHTMNQTGVDRLMEIAYPGYTASRERTAELRRGRDLHPAIGTAIEDDEPA